MGSEPTNYVNLAQELAASGALESLSPPLRMAILLGAFAFLSTAVVSATAFTRIVIVLSFVRRALNTQEIPPNTVVIGLALFLTVFVMGPTIDQIANVAVQPYTTGEIKGVEAIQAGSQVLHEFMITQTRKADLSVMIQIAAVESPQLPADTPMRVLIPAFMISELKTAFIMGFCIYVPFLLIDLVVSALLMSLGMMMMPPVMISLPLKLLLFVLVDGWQLVAHSVAASFG